MTRDTDMVAGGALFTRLAQLGVDWVFVNSGTDFPPVIEGMAQAAALGFDLPRTAVVPHEHAAIGMAHGYWLVSGRPQAVMLHTNVGLANGSAAAINAACEHVPMILMSGRTPVTETGRFGSRTVPISWGQEMSDQASLVREAVKWDYELRYPEQAPELLDRAMAIADTTPKGPVYLSLPREVLAEARPVSEIGEPIRQRPVHPGVDQDAIERAADWLARAEAPLIVAQRGAGDAESFRAFSDWVGRWGIAVASWWVTHLAIATDHDCHVGADPKAALAEADVILVIDSLAPWQPAIHSLRADARVIQMGPDPLFSRFPVRHFPGDIAIAGENRRTLPALIAATDRHGAGHPDRAARLARQTAARRDAETAAIESDLAANRITKAGVGHVLGKALDRAGRSFSVFSELGVPLAPLSCRDHGSWFQEPHSGGLGWAFPAAIGAQLADPDCLCVATMGDGSYLFANPAVCHQIVEAHGLPLLVIVLNNREWGAVRQSVLDMYPDGAAARTNSVPLTSLEPVPDLCAIATASRAAVYKIERAKDLCSVLDAALATCIETRKAAFVEISI